MNIIVNDIAEEIKDRQTMTVRELLTYKTFTFRMLVIKINNQIVKKDDWETAVIKDGDNVSVIHLMSGG